MKSFLIVESPTKAKTLRKYLGRDFVIKATIGHIKDLPEKELGVDIEHGFRPKYQIIKGKKKIVKEVKEQAKRSDKIFLAPDPDREGEAIAWHIAEEIGNGDNQKIYRLLFNDLTKKTVMEALRSPQRLNPNRYHAQQARRILDRLVGYQISPLLWKKVKNGLSAGRVQSVAVRLICEREKEIRSFVPEEYWTITVLLEGEGGKKFEATLEKIDNKKEKIRSRSEAEKIKDELHSAKFIVEEIQKKTQRRNPPPPFITSQLQQEAFKKLRFSAKKTMLIAQRLYEGIELGEEGPVGLITYMRTDSPRISDDAAKEVRSFIESRFGEDYLPAKVRAYKSKKGAQEAHEAIRPTSVARTPESIASFVNKDTLNLYKLIWTRFVACQMNPAILDITTVTIGAGRFKLKATGTEMIFPGFTILYPSDGEEDKDRKELPLLKEGEELELLEVTPKQHFTQPPPRYTEASLIKELEENGIGRPSTYATIISNIKDREYVKTVKGHLEPTELGMLVNELLVENFPNILNVDFTAQMENQLDLIEEGKVTWVQTLEDFYKSFKDDLKKAEVSMRNLKKEKIPTDIRCELCGKNMVIRWGQKGEYLACSDYPRCKNTKNFHRDEAGRIVIEREEELGTCELCGKPMVVREGRFGKFLACTGYPKCKNTKPFSSAFPKPTGFKCPVCEDGEIVERLSKKGSIFYGCSRYPKCDFAMSDRPVEGPCPYCGFPVLAETSDGEKIYCPNKGCDYRK